jgi:hypothetical protein
MKLLAEIRCPSCEAWTTEPVCASCAPRFEGDLMAPPVIAGSDLLSAAEDRYRETRKRIPSEYRRTDPTYPQLSKAAGDFISSAILAPAFPAGAGATFVGPSGRGKTRCATLCLERHAARGRTIGLIYATEIRSRVFSDFGAADKIIREAARPHAFLIDDLGQGAPSDQAEETILAILERRTGEGRPTYVTTQYSFADLLDRFRSPNLGMAVVRRIGKDYALTADFS